MTRRKANAEPAASIAEHGVPEYGAHRTPEYQQNRAQELIEQGGINAKLTAERAAAIDWSAAPESATHYIARHGPSVACAWWLSGTDTMDEAPVFFDLEPGQIERISRASCPLARSPLTGIVDRQGASGAGQNRSEFILSLNPAELALIKTYIPGILVKPV